MFFFDFTFTSFLFLRFLTQFLIRVLVDIRLTVHLRAHVLYKDVNARACVCVRISWVIDSNSDVVKITLHERSAERNPNIIRSVPEQVSLVENHFVVCCIIVEMRTSFSTTLCS